MGAMDFVILQAIQNMGSGSGGSSEPGAPLLAPVAPSSKYLPMDGRVVTRASVPDYAALVPPSIKLNQSPAAISANFLGTNITKNTMGTKELMIDRTTGFAWDQVEDAASGFAWGSFPNANTTTITPGPTGAFGVIGTGHVTISYDNGTTLRTTILPSNHTQLVWLDVPGCWVAYGADYKSISISYDGIVWSHHTIYHASLTAGTMWGVSHLNGTWCVVVNANPYISTDLSTWTQLASLGTNTAPSTNARIITVGGMAMAFADTANAVWPLRTTDFKAWVYCKPPSTSIALSSGVNIVYQNGKFIVAASTGAIYSTVDGNGWTTGTNPTVALVSIGYHAGVYYSSTFGNWAKSLDLITWTACPPPMAAPAALNDIVVGTGSALVVAHSVGFTRTTDFVTWTTGGTQLRNGINLASLPALTINGAIYIQTGSGYVTTSDGWNWVARPAYHQPMAGDGASRIVGAAGAWLGYSDDGGASWTRCASAQTQTVNAVAYGGGVFVAVMNNGAVARSTDNGVTWTPATSGVASHLTGVVYQNGTFVAYGASGGLTTSPDGSTWTPRTSGVSTVISKVIWADTLSLWVLCCYNSGTSNVISTSPDLGTWTARQSAANSMNNIIWQNGLIIVLGANATCYKSSNGTTWTALAGLSGQFNKGAWSATLGVWILPANATQAYYTSPDATTWTSRNTWTGMATQGYAVAPFTTAWGDVLMWSGRGVMGVPTNPLTSMAAWNLLGTNVVDIAVSPTAAVAVNSSGTIYKRTTTSPWVTVAGTMPVFTQAVWDGTQFIAFCATGAIYSSTTGDNGTWAAASSPTTSAFIGAASYNGVTVAYTQAQELVYSTNGTTWAVATIPGGCAFSGLSVVEGVFYALGIINGDVLLLRSSNGSSWTRTTLPLTGVLSYACRLGTRYMLLGIVGGSAKAILSDDNTFTSTYLSTVTNTEFKRTLKVAATSTLLTGFYGAVVMSVAVDVTHVALPNVTSPITGLTYYIRVQA